MAQSFENVFLELCREKHLAVTHQRLVLFRELMQMKDHPSPEEIFERIRPELPSISLATVYKTLRVFLAAGIIREVSPHHGSLRIEPNTRRHYHFLCLQCHAITDLVSQEVEVDVSSLKDSVPEGFQVEQVSLEARGICRQCAEASGHA